MKENLINEFIKIVEKFKLNGFQCETYSNSIVFHFEDENQRINLSVITEFISELDELREIDKSKIELVKEGKFLELWIPFAFKADCIEIFKDSFNIL